MVSQVAAATAPPNDFGAVVLVLERKVLAEEMVVQPELPDQVGRAYRIPPGDVVLETIIRVGLIGLVLLIVAQPACIKKGCLQIKPLVQPAVVK